MRNDRLHRYLAAFLVSFLPALLLGADAPAPSTQPTDLAVQKTLYMVGYAHLDTQWRWTYPQVVNQFLANTLHQNFALLEKYPTYVFNFTGARRYMLMKEYFPDDYQKMKQYIAAGRWFPGGSSVDETDQNVPSAESIVRQVLYGNHFFRSEFGKVGEDFMLPDCFGFPASLPSVLAHCSIKGFSTQKLSWGSAVGIPFNVGVWEGVDGQSILAAFNPGSYTTKITQDLSHDPRWLDRISLDGKTSGNFFDFGYYGTGDRGGAPDETSVDWIAKSVAGDGPIRVVAGSSDQMFKDITPQQRETLPRYKGELLLTWHSTGSLSSQAYMKRWNRKNELLADSAERASVAAAWLGNTPYPQQKLNSAWLLVLGSQMHDILPGDCLPKAYEYSWNDEVLALNQFAAVATDATGGVAAGMDTQSKGVPLIVYNPLAFERQDVVEATVTFPGDAPAAINVIGPDGKPVSSQILARSGSTLHLLFLADVPSVSFSTFDVQAATNATPAPSPLKITNTSVENARYLVTLNQNGDVDSILDKTTNTQLLSGPLRLGFLHENPSQYPAWNMDWEDRKQESQKYVAGPPSIKIVENGPVRVALEVTRESNGSKFAQGIRLSAGTAGDRVEFPTHIDWRSTECSLEAVMPLGVSSPTATYDTQVGTMQRGNNNPKKYEVPQQQWFDATDANSHYGVSVLNDSKYGSDKPDDKTVRLTLLYTPGVRAGYQDEGSQDFGRHEMIYALQGHTGDWREARTGEQAARLNQPLEIFTTTAHPGQLGKSFSLVSVDNPQVAVQAMKKAEDSDEFIIRVKETRGKPMDAAQISFAAPLVSAREVDGQEAALGPAVIRDGKLQIALKPYHLRAYAVKLAPPPQNQSATVCKTIGLPFNLDVVSTNVSPRDGAFDQDGRTYPAEQLPPEIVSEDIHFKIGPTTDGQKNGLACRGQTLQIPSGSQRLYLLAASLDGDATGQFKLGDRAIDLTVHNWTGLIGQWDNRLWKGKVSLLTYNWNNRLDGLVPGFIKRDTVAWYADHVRHPENGNEVYEYCYLFKYALDVPAGASTLALPDNDRIRVFAITAATAAHDAASPAHPLYDTLEDHVRQGAPRAVTAGDQQPDQGFNDSIPIRLEPPLYWQDGNLRYTADGSEPTASSPAYGDPIWLSSNTTIKAREFDPAGNAGPILQQSFKVNDTTPPAIRSVRAVPLENTIRVTLSEPVQREGAENSQNYRFDPPIVVTSAKLLDDQTSIELTTSDTSSDINPGRNYQLAITGVHDRSPAGNVIATSPFPVDMALPLVNIPAFSASNGKSFEQKAANLPTRSGEPWTINCFVNPSARPSEKIVIAGFGTCADNETGLGRYLAWFPGGVHYWTRNRDVTTDVPLDIGKWQMLTAVYDGKTVSLYKNSDLVGSGDLRLADDGDSVVRLAPLDPWQKSQQFKGEIRSFAIWPTALSIKAIEKLNKLPPGRQ